MTSQPGSGNGQVEDERQRRRRRLVLWWLVAAGAALALIVIVVVVFAANGDDDPEQSASLSTASPTQEPAGTPGSSPTGTVEPTSTQAATPTTAPTSTPTTPAAKPEPTASPTTEATATATSTPAATATATATASATPAPTASPTPSPEPTPANTGPIALDEPIANGLVGLWHFDGNAMDSSGLGNHGVPNAVTYGAGVFGQALGLNGTSAFVRVPDDPSLNPTTAISVQAWYRAPFFTGVGNNALIDKGAVAHVSPFYQYHMGITGQGYLPGGTGNEVGFSFVPGGEDAQFLRASTAQMTPDVWHHLVFTYDGQTAALYVDGVRTNSRDVTGDLPGFGDPGFSTDLFIGTFANRRSPADHVPGSVDEVAIWNRALTQAEVVELFDRGSG